MTHTGLNIVFAGTPEFGLSALDAIFHSHHHINAIYTQPDRPSGRGQQLQPSPIKRWALDHDISVYQPENFRQSDIQDELKALKPDLMVVIAYGIILPKAVLEIPKYGCINVHSSLLPAWRGAAPIQSAILNGDTITGVTVMKMDVGMDAGPILATTTTPIYGDDTAGKLHDRLAQLSPSVLLEVISQIEKGDVNIQEQVHSEATYSKKIQKEDAAIQWIQPAAIIARTIRAYFPWPIAYTTSQTHRVRIFEAVVEAYSGVGEPGEILKIDMQGMLVMTGKDALRIKQFQFPGGKVLSVSDWRHAASPSLVVGQKLG